MWTRVRHFCIGYVLGSLVMFFACSGQELMHRATEYKIRYAFAAGFDTGIAVTVLVAVVTVMIFTWRR